MTRENEVVDERNADFLWHSNEALRNELEKKEKELTAEDAKDAEKRKKLLPRRY